MGKVVSDLDSDVAALTQWVWRKLRNHDPMSVRDAPKRHTGVRDQLRVSEFNENSNVVRYAMNDGRVFEVTVVQVEGASPAPLTVDA